MPYPTKDKGNLHHLGPCTSSVQGDHWLFWALWNVNKRLATLLSPQPWAWGAPPMGVKLWRFWAKQWRSHSTRQHNGSKWVGLLACGSCPSQSSGSNSYASPTSPIYFGREVALEGNLLFIHGRPGVALLWVSMHKSWHKLYVSGREWLNILWCCTTETDSYLPLDVIPVSLKPRFTRISTGNNILRYFICSWVRTEKWKLFLQKAEINKSLPLVFIQRLRVALNSRSYFFLSLHDFTGIPEDLKKN